MPSMTDWKVPSAVQPRAEDYSFDLERTLTAMVGLHTIVPDPAEPRYISTVWGTGYKFTDA